MSNFLSHVEGRTENGDVVKEIYRPEKESVSGGRRNSIIKRFFVLLWKY